MLLVSVQCGNVGHFLVRQREVEDVDILGYIWQGKLLLSTSF